MFKRLRMSTPPLSLACKAAAESAIKEEESRVLSTGSNARLR